jgi:hypothetical protein
MVYRSRISERALDEFIGSCAEPLPSAEEFKAAVRESIDQAYTKMMDSIKPGRFLIDIEADRARYELEKNNTTMDKTDITTIDANESHDGDMAMSGTEGVGEIDLVDVDESHVPPQQSDPDYQPSAEGSQQESDSDYEESDQERPRQRRGDDKYADSEEERGEMQLNETYVFVNGNPIAIWQYLGNEWTQDIVSFACSCFSTHPRRPHC